MSLSMLVPLDQTPLAEEALLLALNIARQGGGRVDLVQVHGTYGKEEAHLRFMPYQPLIDARSQEKERTYLQATRHWAHAQSAVPVTAKLLPGSVVLPETVGETILEHARQANNDMIVMATQGRGIFRRLGEGSVGDEILRHSNLPLLLARRDQHNESNTRYLPTIDHILVLLDGSELAEAILEPVINLAAHVQARCTLLRVVTPHTRPVEPGVPETVKALRYLDAVVERLQQNGVNANRRVTVARSVAEAVHREIETEACNLIALATHGRGGIQRLLLGSVADRLVQRGTVPILVVRPETHHPG